MTLIINQSFCKKLTMAIIGEGGHLCGRLLLNQKPKLKIKKMYLYDVGSKLLIIVLYVAEQNLFRNFVF